MDKRRFATHLPARMTARGALGLCLHARQKVWGWGGAPTVTLCVFRCQVHLFEKSFSPVSIYLYSRYNTAKGKFGEGKCVTREKTGSLRPLRGLAFARDHTPPPNSNSNSIESGSRVGGVSEFGRRRIQGGGGSSFADFTCKIEFF